MGWLYDNTWVIGIIYLVFGPLIAFFGSKLFPYITSTLVGFFVVTILCSISLNAGWMVSMGGSIATICVAVVLGVIAACIVVRYTWLMISLLGMVAGFFGGTFLFALISGMTGGNWNAVWGYWVIAVGCAIVGAVLALYLGLPLVIASTSLVGSYLFMRSWTLFFPGSYPSEEALIASKGQDALEMDTLFWVYVSVFVVTFLVSITYQCKYASHHKSLSDHYQAA